MKEFYHPSKSFPSLAAAMYLLAACGQTPTPTSIVSPRTSPPAAAIGTITTVAGTGSFGFSGDGGPATSAMISPAGIAVDAAGRIYFTDGQTRVRWVNTNGVITTVAGNGALGFSSEGGPATAAALSYPLGVAIDGKGNIYIADSSNGRVRRVDSSGVITTVAGTGRPPATFSGEGGPATSASLGKPYAVAVDAASSLYIADGFAFRVLKVDNQGTIATLAGTGPRAGYSGDGGPATAASLALAIGSPLLVSGVAVDSAGNVFIADSFNNRVRRVDRNGTITTVAGNGSLGSTGDGGPASAASIGIPTGLAVDRSRNLYIVDSVSSRVRKVDLNGTITTVAGNGTAGYSGDGGPATLASLNQPSGIAVDVVGNLYIADTLNSRVRKVLIAPA